LKKTNKQTKVRVSRGVLHHPKQGGHDEAGPEEITKRRILFGELLHNRSVGKHEQEPDVKLSLLEPRSNEISQLLIVVELALQK
jgi:hypothetical protein